MSGIWWFWNSAKAALSRISWEALAAGQQIGDALAQPSAPSVLGAQTESLASEAAAKA